QLAAIVRTVAVRTVRDLQPLDGRGEGHGRARAIAIEGERRTQLGLRQSRAEAFQPGLDKVAKVADRGPPGTGKVVEGVGDTFAAAIEVRGVRHLIGEV